ncbi:MAG: hypothetical protein LBL45_05445, partial [Treponema sp.]|nr:hypothetical protein [Treponema sp.]
MSGDTADERLPDMGRGTNPNRVLSVTARKLGSRNMFNAAVINMVTGVQEAGQTANYESLEDGVTAMEELAFALGGERRAWTVSDAAGFAQAVAAINAETNGRAYTITLGESFSSDPVRFTGNAAKTITLKGDNSARTISNNGGDALFTVPSGITLVLDSNLTLNGNGKEARVVFVKGGALIMKEGSTVRDSQDGGVYVVEGGAFTLEGGEIRDNRAFSSSNDAYGGGVHVNSGTFIMSGGVISDNAVSSSSFSVFGGGVFVWESAFTMSGGAIRGNTASGSYSDGGGVYVSGNSIFTMSGGTISGNAVEGGGGGVHIWNSAFRMSGGSISNNRASSSDSFGGGVYVSSNSTFTMSGGSISNNAAHDGGGGVFVNAATFTMESGEIRDNIAFKVGGGGGVYMASDNSAFTMLGGAISGNAVENGAGGGVIVGGSNSAFRMTGGTISKNTAAYGGGVYLQDQNNTFRMIGGSISGNTVSNDGGGVFVNKWKGGATFTKSGDSAIDDTNRANRGKAVYV